MGCDLEDLRQKEGLSLRGAGDLIGVSHTTVRRWEKRGYVRDDKVDAYAKVLGVEPDKLREEQGTPPSSYVRGPGDFDGYRAAVSRYSCAGPVKLLLMLLLEFFDEDLRAAAVTKQSMADISGYDLDDVDAHWQDVLDSPFVEQVGSVEYVMKLKAD